MGKGALFAPCPPLHVKQRKMVGTFPPSLFERRWNLCPPYAIELSELESVLRRACETGAYDQNGGGSNWWRAA